MNEEKIYKLIDKDGFINSHRYNKDYLDKYGIVEGEDILLKGYITDDGDLISSIENYLSDILIFPSEFKFFEEIKSIPDSVSPSQGDSLPNREYSERTQCDHIIELHDQISAKVKSEGFVFVKGSNLSERVYQFAKEHKLYTSYDGEKDYFVVLILDIDYKISTIEDLDKLDEMYKLHKELMI